MKCPHCHKKLKMLSIFSGRCNGCHIDFKEFQKKKHNIFTFINIVIALLVYTIVKNIFDYFSINSIASEMISFGSGLMVLCIFQYLLMLKIIKNIK